jgi:hypothetical protein
MGCALLKGAISALFNALPLEGSMKKLLLTCASLVLLAGPAFAQDTSPTDPTLVVTDLTIKRILTRESILVATLVDARATVRSAPDKFAESMVTANQNNTENRACGNCAEKDDLITASGNNNAGIISMNQASGNNSNQGTIVSVAIDADSDGDGEEDAPSNVGFAHASAAATQSQSANTIDTVNLVYRDAVITGSLNSNQGLIYANQSSGNMNNQLNTLSLAYSLAKSGVALSEAALGQFNTGGRVGESTSTTSNVGINKLSRISNSMNDNVGIVGVNQSSGNMANQANIVSIAAIGTNLPTF